MNVPRRTSFLFLSLSLAASAASAQEPVHPLGAHPAVLAHRQAAQAGYDYASKFYPHPAWLYLCAEPARPAPDQAAVAAPKERSTPERLQLTGGAPSSSLGHATLNAVHAN